MSRSLPNIPVQSVKFAAIAERNTARWRAEALFTPEIGGYARALRMVAQRAVIALIDPTYAHSGDEEICS